MTIVHDDEHDEHDERDVRLSIDGSPLRVRSNARRVRL